MYFHHSCVSQILQVRSFLQYSILFNTIYQLRAYIDLILFLGYTASKGGESRGQQISEQRGAEPLCAHEQLAGGDQWQVENTHPMVYCVLQSTAIWRDAEKAGWYYAIHLDQAVAGARGGWIHPSGDLQRGSAEGRVHPHRIGAELCTGLTSDDGME